MVNLKLPVKLRGGIEVPLKPILYEILSRAQLSRELAWEAERLADKIELSDEIELSETEISTLKAAMSLAIPLGGVGNVIEYLFYPNKLAESDRKIIANRYGGR